MPIKVKRDIMVFTPVFWGPYYSIVTTRGPIEQRIANVVKTALMAISEWGPTSAPLNRSYRQLSATFYALVHISLKSCCQHRLADYASLLLWLF